MDAQRILVVDDEPRITDLVSMALRYEGFEVETAGTGRAGLKAVEDFRPALIVLDVMLPDMDGFAVTERLTADRVKVPVLFLTARDARRAVRRLPPAARARAGCRSDRDAAPRLQPSAGSGAGPRSAGR